MTATRQLLAAGLVLTLAIVACDTKDPATVLVTAPTPTTTTTSVPVGPPPTSSIPSTTTSIPTLATTRTYVGLGAVPPNVPSQLTIIIQPLTRSIVSSLLDYVPYFGSPQADPLVWTVTGFYRTPSGGAGQVSGSLSGTLDDGSFSGTLTAESPECVAEREYGGTVDPQFLRWFGGRTLRDCKGSPLSFDTLTMLATNAPPPTTTAISTSTTTLPLTCSYALSASSVSVDASGGQRTVGVTTGPTCSWTVQNFVDWIKVQPTSAIGAGTVNLEIAANSGPPRSATLVIAGQPFVVNQGVVTTTSSTSTTSVEPTTTTSTPSTTTTTTTVCSYTIKPPERRVSWRSSTNLETEYLVSIDTSSICTWTASTSASWIFFRSPTAGLGPGEIRYGVTQNNGPERVGAIAIATQEHRVIQNAFNTTSPAPGPARIPRD